MDMDGMEKLEHTEETESAYAYEPDDTEASALKTYERRKKNATVDVLTFQAIVCIALVTVFLLLNLIQADWARLFSQTFHEHVAGDNNNAAGVTDFLEEVYNTIVSVKPLQKGESSQAESEVTSADQNSGMGGGMAAPLSEAVSVQALAGFASYVFAVPVTGTVTSGFGERADPFTGEAEHHDGIDIAQAQGTPIVATLDGKVIAAATEDLAGNYVKIEHDNGLVSLYMHCDAILAKEGDSVSKGQVIATVGSTGNSTAPHLHFELRIGGVPIDPALLVDLGND